MSNSSVSNTFNSSLNIISLFADIIALLICSIFLCAIIFWRSRFKNNYGQVTVDVPLILSMNTFCIIITKSTLQIIHVTIPTLLKDFEIIIEFKETSFHRICAYVLWSMIGVLYCSYSLLAFLRYVRVIYPTKLWLHRTSLYLYVLIPGQFVCVFICMLPVLLIFDGIHLLPNDAYCSILIKPFYLLIYTSAINFAIPYSSICIFYFLISRKIKQTSAIRPYRERNQRDYIVSRRMLLNVMVLCIVTVPYLIIYTYDIIHDDFDPLIYRVQWLSSSLSSCLFSLTIPLITTQLRDFFKTID